MRLISNQNNKSYYAGAVQNFPFRLFGSPDNRTDRLGVTMEICQSGTTLLSQARTKMVRKILVNTMAAVGLASYIGSD